jgi:hypothetical protein
MVNLPRSFALALALVACGTSTTTPATPDASAPDANAPDVSAPDANAPDASAPDVPAGDVAPPPGDAAMVRREVTIPDRMIAPGEEITMCREVRLGNADAMLIRRIHVSIPTGSHHVIVYRSRATTEQPELRRCMGLGGILEGTAPIFIAQQHESGIDFPAGVGLDIAANQMIRLEEHFVNTGPAPILAGARVTFDLSPRAGLTVADMMFWGTQGINVPPRSMGRAQYFRPALPAVNVFGLTSHTHQYGVRSTVEVATALTGAGREVHRSESWEEPPLTRFEPPLTFGENEGLRLVCNYNNTSDQTLRFGESFYQEMCFLWAYYYPSQGFHVCFDGFCRALRL